MTGDGRRARRVAETLRAHLAAAIAREMADPLLGSVVITGVDLSDDLGVARIHVRLLVGDDQPTRRAALLRALERAASRLRRAVVPALRLRRAPELSFDYDTGHDASRRVDELLAEIAREPKSEE